MNIAKVVVLSLSLIVSTNSLCQIPDSLSDSEKLYGLSLLWQEANYNFVFRENLRNANWDQAYQAYIDSVSACNNDYEYYRTLQRFCALLNDGHTNVFYPRSFDFIYHTHFGQYRIVVSNVEEKAIVTSINESKVEEIPIGSEVIEVNSMQTRQYLERKVSPYISSSTDHVKLDVATRSMFEGLKGTEFNVKFRRPDGSIHSVKLIHEDWPPEPMVPVYPKLEPLQLKPLGNSINCVSINTFADPEVVTSFEAILDDLKDSEALVIDLRNNGGGSTENALGIVNHLTEDDVVYGSKSKSLKHIASYKAWGAWTTPEDTADSDSKKYYQDYHGEYFYDFKYSPDTLEEDRETLVVPTYILIGHNTASAAEDFLIYLDNQDHVILVGQPTNGSTGQPLYFSLPGGGEARVCTKEDMYPDGRKFIGVGIKPDYYVQPTVESIIHSTDPALDYVLDLIKKR